MVSRSCPFCTSSPRRAFTSTTRPEERAFTVWERLTSAATVPLARIWSDSCRATACARGNRSGLVTLTILRSGTDSTVAAGAGDGLACAGSREQPERGADKIATARVPRKVTLGGVLELGMLLSQVTDKQRSRLGLSPLLAHTRVAVRPVVDRPYQDGQDAHTNEQLGDVKPTHGTTLHPNHTPERTGGVYLLDCWQWTGTSAGLKHIHHFGFNFGLTAQVLGRYVEVGWI